LHSLAIAKFLSFSADTKVLDLGTGGGFPGLPLAVMFPEVHFHLVDRIGKKLKVVADVIEQLGLKNVTFQHGDIGECHEEFDFVVSRAVMDMPDIVRLTRKNIRQGGRNAVFNGWLILKGGELDAELGKLSAISETVDLSMWFEEPFFLTKKLVYTPRR
ncbi:MAG: 16S rRNA (guanine(527)-N(7))-methyltransferase RsmG, partial [Muribaculaceae bacterium]|nr:16S rRNA (guanine(527)-N(7))-methyltransferase RsmG [Muribaculaceae bacterium]